MTNADGLLVGVGYAGHAEGVNNPALQAVRNVGPLPCGGYTISEMLDKHIIGNLVLVWCVRLTPDADNEMFGRDGFLIHGDNDEGNKSASEGCIVLSFNQRMKVLNSNDKRLAVVA